MADNPARCTRPREDGETSLRIERDAQTRRWAVRDKDGSLVCLCLDKRGTENVVQRVRSIQRAGQSIPARGSLSSTQRGLWLVQLHVGYKRHTGKPQYIRFYERTRDDAEKVLRKT